jgi:hypothetical protein
MVRGNFRGFIGDIHGLRYLPVGYDVNIKWRDHGKGQGAQGTHPWQQNNLYRASFWNPPR